MSFPYESSRRLDKAIERVMVGILRVGGWASVLVTFGIVITLVTESWPFFKAVPLGRLFTDRMWTPLFLEPQYGIGALLAGTYNPLSRPLFIYVNVKSLEKPEV
ncbi:MAG: hypothetical protein EBY81_06655, partial [Verrucomicrobia bacterium]|nr:hypothetical protein [Verrucomicrobiota bacterium]